MVKKIIPDEIVHQFMDEIEIECKKILKKHDVFDRVELRISAHSSYISHLEAVTWVSKNGKNSQWI